MTKFMHWLAWLICQIAIRPFIRVVALPQPLPIDIDKPCILLLPETYASDELALKTCARQLGINQYDILFLPRVDKNRANKRFNETLGNAVEKNPDVQLVPCSVFWGRTPGKVNSAFQAYLADGWAVPGMIRRRTTVLLKMRYVSCYFGQTLDSQQLIGEGAGIGIGTEIGAEDDTEFRQARHQLITDQCRKQKEAAIGPDLSHRRMLSQQVLQSSTVRDCIDELADESKQTPKALNKKARKYLNEMAADYSYSAVRFLDIFLSWLWEKLYRGTHVNGMRNVLSVAENHQLIYVPCHRSHIDYLLLSYVVHEKGLMPPHIAAGINLNLPIIGKLLRRSGAFFIRREFRGNKLYRAVLESYIATMCQQGFPIEYFIEGARSRTGFLLPHKSGMLAMTLRAAQDQRHRPLAFIPVYIGYERLLESLSYINELYGEKIEKESIMGLFSARHYLKDNYGKVSVSFGKAIFPEDIWRSLDVTSRPKPNEGSIFHECVYRLGQTIQTEVNNNASLSTSNLIATALLGSNRHALVESQLLLQIDVLQALIKLPIYQQSLYFEVSSHQEAIDNAMALSLIRRNEHALGDIYYLDQKAQVSATFLRNNSLHVFILPSLIASIFINTEKSSFKRIYAICYRLYPYLKAEFFLPWELDQLDRVIERILTILQNAKLIVKTDICYSRFKSETEQFHTLLILSGACKATAERFYITTQLVNSQPKAYYDKKSLEDACVQMAERLSLLHEFHAPDFFDKNLFRIFIASLIREQLFTVDDQGKLDFSDSYLKIKGLDRYVLTPSVKRSIRYITRTSL